MASYRYPLQKIVDLKGSEKSMAEWEYAASLGALRREEEKLDLWLKEREELERRLADAAVRPTPLTRLMELQHYLEVVDHRIRDGRDGVRQAESVVLQRQSHLSGKMIDEKVWLNARDRAKERFRAEWLAKEQNELDEIAIVRAAAASRG